MPFWTPSFLEASLRTPFGETRDMEVSGACFPSLFYSWTQDASRLARAAYPARKV